MKCFSDFGRNVIQDQTSYILLCSRSLLQALHTQCKHLYSLYANFTQQRTVFSVVCNKLEVSGTKLKRHNNKG